MRSHPPGRRVGWKDRSKKILRQYCGKHYFSHSQSCPPSHPHNEGSSEVNISKEALSNWDKVPGRPSSNERSGYLKITLCTSGHHLPPGKKTSLFSTGTHKAPGPSTSQWRHRSPGRGLGGRTPTGPYQVPQFSSMKQAVWLCWECWKAWSGPLVSLPLKHQCHPWVGSGRASLIIPLRWINITKLWVSQGSWTNCLLSVALCQAADTSSFPSINLLYSARLMAQGKGSTASFPPSVYAGEAESCPEAAERDQKWLCAVLSLVIKLPSVFTQDFYSLGAF